MQLSVIRSAMADFKSKPGAFLAYMESTNRAKFEQRESTSPLSLLAVLNQNLNRSLPIFELQEHSGMEPSRYAEAIKKLQQIGYISIDGDPTSLIVKLTDSGLSTLQLAQPA